MSDNDRLTKLENYFKMRGDRLEDIEQSLTDLESEIDTLHNVAIRLVKDIDQMKDELKADRELKKSVSQLIADIQNELNDNSEVPKQYQIGEVVRSIGVYPIHLKGIHEDHNYIVIVGLALSKRIPKNDE